MFGLMYLLEWNREAIQAKTPVWREKTGFLQQSHSTCLEVKMMACPIKDAWVEAGCSQEEIVTLLYCASALDEATLEAAGFDFEIELWSPGQEGCCLTRITEKTQR